MKVFRTAALLTLGALAGCMAGGPATTAQTPPEPRSPIGSPFGAPRGPLGTPLLLDRTDMRIGTTAQFDRMPSTTELNDLNQLQALAHVVVTLPAWPETFESLGQLGLLPEPADMIVILPGYPPNRAAAEGWNYLSGRLRIIVVASGLPPSATVVQDMNAMRHLERLIVQTDDPSRFGLERLQRPVSFLKRFD